MRVLVVNTGSSSLKLTVLHRSGRVGDGGGADAGDAGWEVEGSAHLERWDGEHDLDQLESVIADAGPLEAVGHRVVHGGTDLTAPTLLTGEVEDRI
ncbi:MAG: hypothetical protein ACRDPR_03535, partial [Nocardioidaceae bacterium]